MVQIMSRTQLGFYRHLRRRLHVKTEAGNLKSGPIALAQNPVRNLNESNPKPALTPQQSKILSIVKTLVRFYDAVTLPAYMAIQQPWKLLARRKLPKSIELNKTKSIYGTSIPRSEISLDLEQRSQIKNLDDLFAVAFQRYGPRPCTGTRSVVRVELDGQKHLADEYRWKTFAQIEEISNALSLGFATIGIQPKDKIAIFAETREEWLITAIAAFKRNLAVVTIFSVLGNDGVVHAINETDVSCVFTSDELLPRCKEILEQTPCVKNLIYMGSVVGLADHGIPSRIKVRSLERLISNGAKSFTDKGTEFKPSPHDTAIIMYTSGSTGVPKGVVLSHWNLLTNLLSTIDSLTFSMGSFGPAYDDLYPGYLPVAHVMELIGELFALAQGVPIGFSSPTTLIDSSVGIRPGARGDLVLLRPTCLPSAPLVLERIVKGIKSKVAEKGQLASAIFDFFYDYKVRWVKKGYGTPLLNRVFYRKFRAAVGGRVRLVTVGGAPLAAHTQEFIETVLCAPVCISYGMTESAGLGAFTFAFDVTPGRVGGPIGRSTVFRLVNWEEGGYKTTDSPLPRGEVYIGGENVATNGYFKRPDIGTFLEEDGVRWVKTGDIAELHPDGGFHVIDRKKDLVKLSNGEYISLGKVESILKIHPLVENICMVVDPFEAVAGAVMVPVPQQLLSMAQTLGKSKPLEELCQDTSVKEAVLAQLQVHGKSHKLEKHELPYKIHLSPEPWTPQSSLVTAALKNQRVNISRAFQPEITAMYKKDVQQ